MDPEAHPVPDGAIRGSAGWAAMKRRELFKLGLAATIAPVLPKPQSCTMPLTWVSTIRMSFGGHEIQGLASGGPVRFDAVQRTRSYNHMALHPRRGSA